jgi:hypothetical protein
MHTSTGTLVVALYPDRATAKQDLRAIRDLRSDEIDVIYAALVAKDSAGFVSSQRTFAHHPAHRTPEALRLDGRFHRGLTHGDIRQLGMMLERSSIAIVLVLSGEPIDGVIDQLQTEEIMVDQLTSEDLAFRGLLRAYNGIGYNTP